MTNSSQDVISIIKFFSFSWSDAIIIQLCFLTATVMAVAPAI